MKLTLPIYKLKRQAKILARTHNLKLYQALDKIARIEGFANWGHLASSYSNYLTPAKEIISQFDPGDMMLIGARPGHGKTLLGLELAALANNINRGGYIFSLDYNDQDIWAALEKLGVEPDQKRWPLMVDTSENICAAYVIEKLRRVKGPMLVVIDYLQLLDQKRSHDPLHKQIQLLEKFSADTGTIFVLISQIDRKFELSSQPFPTIDDVRLPNPVDLSVFNKMCFLHDGDIQIQQAA